MSIGLIIFCYCIMAYGICNMMVFGSGPFRIFEFIRNVSMEINDHFGTLFSCMMCLPTNLGIILSLINWFFVPTPFTPYNILFGADVGFWWLAMIFDGAFTSGIVWLIHHVEEFFETIAEGQKISPNIDDNDEDGKSIIAEDITLKKR